MQASTRTTPAQTTFSINSWVSQETKNKIYSYYKYISNVTTATTSAAWEKARVRYHRNAEIIRTTMEEINSSSKEEQQTLFIDALAGPSYSLLRHELTSFFHKLKPEVQHEYLTVCSEDALEKNNPELINRAMNLLDDKQMLNLAAVIEKTSPLTLETCLKHYKLFFEINNEYYAYQRTRAFLKSEIRYMLPFLFHRFTGIFELLYKSTQFLEPGQGSKSSWDANFQWELLGRFISIPAFILLTLNSYFPNPILTAAAFTLTLAALTVFVYSYIKWFKPVPNSLPYTVNMTHHLKIGKLPHVCGRDFEIGQVVEQFFDNIISTNRQHPLFIGESGVGKTSMINALVEELAKPGSHIPDELKGLTVFYVNATEISKKDPYAPKSRLKEIRDAIGTHGHKVVLIVDEIQKLMKSEESGYLLSLLDTSNDNLPFFIGITSKEKFEKTDGFKEEEFKRRFKEINLSSTNKDSTIHILKETLKNEAPEIGVKNQEIYKHIFELPKSENALEPATSKAHLSRFQGEIRRNLAGRHLVKRLNQLDLELKNAKSNMVGSAPPLATAEVVWKLEDKINEVKKEIAEHKKVVNEYKRLKEEIREKELFLNDLTNQIDPSKIAANKTNKVALQFLFERYYLLPAMEKALVKFATGHNLEVVITKELIEKTLAKKNESASSSNSQ